VFDSRQAGSFADVYSPDEVAEAAGVTVDRVYSAIAAGYAVLFRGFVAEADAVRLVRRFRRAGAEVFQDRTLVSAPIEMKRRRPFGLAASAMLHVVGLIVLLLMTSLGLFTGNDTDQTVEKDPKPIHSRVSDDARSGRRGWRRRAEDACAGPEDRAQTAREARQADREPGAARSGRRRLRRGRNPSSKRTRRYRRRQSNRRRARRS
jgi:hypothetical protein